MCHNADQDEASVSRRSRPLLQPLYCRGACGPRDRRAACPPLDPPPSRQTTRNAGMGTGTKGRRRARD